MPRKNIVLLSGKPLIAYTIGAALTTSSLDRVIVSTEDEEIAKVAREYGADIPFYRPLDLAQDDTLIFPVLAHALNWLSEHESYRPEYIMLLQPTSPFRAAEDIEAAINIAMTTRADAVVSVTIAHQHPYWMKQVAEDGRLTDFFPSDQIPSRRQELPQVYALNGAIYLANTSVFLERQSFYTDRTYAYVMPPERSLDIDSTWELYLAERVLRDKGQL